MGNAAGGGEENMEDRKESVEKEEEESVIGEKKEKETGGRGGISHLIPSEDDSGHSSSDSDNDDNDNHNSSNKDEEREMAKRDKIRHERRKERIRELRMDQQRSKKHPSTTNSSETTIKKARLESDRDISEKIALGVHTVGNSSNTNAVDSRLYNQNAGLDSGFGAEDEYNTYTKPMFDRSGVSSSSIYRPTRDEGGGVGNMDGDEQLAELKRGATGKFQPDRGFSGA